MQNLNSSFTKFDSGIQDLAVYTHFVRIVTFAISYTYWTLADAWEKKDEHLENQKCHFGSM